MKSYTTLRNLFGSLSSNIASGNLTLGDQLINDQHRYLLQKYFDNEKSYQTTTVGGQSLTLTGSLSTNATSATLTSSWSYPTGYQLTNFSNGNQRSVLFTNGSASITWIGGLTSSATTAISTVGMQAYPIPANISKIINSTISVGQLKYTASPIQTRDEWDNLNTLPYTSDIVNQFFIYNGNVEFFPIPSTTGNLIQFNYKSRVPDLNIADYSTGTLASSGMTVGSVTVTGSSTNWNSSGNFPLGVDVTGYNLYIRAVPPNGDGIWYQIRQFNSNTSLTLVSPIQSAPNITGSTAYTIGQFPLLQEDFHDMLVHGPLMIYFSSINKDPNQYKLYKDLFDARSDLLEDYAGNKQVNVDLGGQLRWENPNTYLYANNS